MKAELQAARTAKRERKIKRNKRKEDICRFETVLLTVKPFFSCINNGGSGGGLWSAGAVEEKRICWGGIVCGAIGNN